VRWDDCGGPEPPGCVRGVPATAGHLWTRRGRAYPVGSGVRPPGAAKQAPEAFGRGRLEETRGRRSDNGARRGRRVRPSAVMSSKLGPYLKGGPNAGAGPGCAGGHGRGGSSCVCLFGACGRKRTNASAPGRNRAEDLAQTQIREAARAPAQPPSSPASGPDRATSNRPPKPGRPQAPGGVGRVMPPSRRTSRPTPLVRREREPDGAIVTRAPRS
jgi:hypothetical protein